jgi:hypothetical protein
MGLQPAIRPVDPVDEEALDSVEVPAAVVCARCGRPDCPGCESLEENTLPSGVISIVPWERPGMSAWSRIWSTARAATRAAPQFFESLPPGDLGPAIRFAVLSELAAIVSWTLVLSLLLIAIAPSLAWSVLQHPRGQAIALRLLLVGTLGFTTVLVGGHLLYGLALDTGARRCGARPHRSQAMRYGLYSTGWDILTSPIGFLVSLVGEGPRATAALVPLAVDVPGKAATAFLRGIYKLDEPALGRARRFGTAIAVVASVVSAVIVLVALGLAVVV